MSPTWFKKFEACQAEALAEIKGEFKPSSDQTALLVGNYIHSYFESSESHDKFVNEHSDKIIKRDGNKRSEYVQADAMINTLETDEMFKQLYQGQKEVIVTGKIAGVDWMGKIDCLSLDRGIFLDLKTTRELHKRYWSTEERSWVPFVIQYNYPLQMAVYQELIKQTFGVKCDPYIVAVTKESPPDKAVISIPDYRLEGGIEEVESGLEEVEQVIHGERKPANCDHCEYCRSIKSLEDVIDVDDLLED